MSTADVILVAAIVMLAIGFAALIVVLLRVHDTTTHLRREVDRPPRRDPDVDR